MGLRRSIALGIAAFSLVGLSMYGTPVRAEEGELAGQDAKAQINLRSLANTQANIVEAGKTGDRVQILGTSKASDGVVWYRVKMLKSGQLGWVRGDLIKVSGKVSSKPKAATTQKPAPKSTAASKQGAATPGKSTASVPLTPPKPAATPRKASPTAAAPKAAEPTKSSAVEPKTTENGASPEQTAAASQSVIVAFQTPTYAVRIFSEAGHLRLNLYNRKSQQLALDAVPVESKNSGTNTTYSYSSDLKVTVAVPTQGTPTLTTVALGNTLQEQPENISPPSGVTDVAPKKTTE